MHRFVSGVLALLIAFGVVVVVSESASAAIPLSVKRYCNNHHNTMASEWGQNISVFVDSQPIPATTSGETDFQVGYWSCRAPGYGTILQPRWVGGCYKHTGLLPSAVLQGIRTDYVGAISTSRRHEVDDMFTEVHPPVHRGDRYCQQAWFVSRKWVKRSDLYRWRVNYWEVTDGGHADQHHESPAIFLDPRNDRMLTPFRHIA